MWPVNAEPHPNRRRSSTSYESVRLEIWTFLELAIPTVILQVGFVFSPFLTASIVGRKFGSTYLSGFTLANLTGNLFSLSLLSGLYSASDTLSPQAFGAKNYKEVGLIAIRALMGSVLLFVPINLVLFFYLETALVQTGQDPEAAKYAAQWYRIYVFALPFFAVYNVTWKFLSAQNVMRPILYVTVICVGIILPLSLEFFTEWFGFVGSAMAFLCLQASQAILLLLYMWWKVPHHAGTWPGLACWLEALNASRVKEFASLAAGGMLAQSEWIYWEALGLIIGTLGVVPLSVHTIPTQIIMALFMTPFGIGTALAIRMGVSLPVSVRRTKMLVIATSAVSAVVIGVVTVLVYVFREWIYSLFTTEQEVIDGAEEIWWKVCVYSYLVSFFAIFIGVSTGLGMQWTLGVVNFTCLWIIGIPISYYSAVIQGNGLSGAWTWIILPYAMIDAILAIAFVCKDWHAFSQRIRDREGMGDLFAELPVESFKDHGHADHHEQTVDESTRLL